MTKVLIVDDEQRTLDGVAQRVRNSGFDVEIAGLAHDGVEALELTLKHCPGIVLCDVRMPGMDGIAYALKAKQIDPDIAVIFMSGYSDREYLKTAIRIGAVDYLDKPVDDEQFVDALGRAIRRRETARGKPAGQTFDPEALRLLLTSNNEDILRRTSGLPPDDGGESVVLVASMQAHERSDGVEQLINLFTLHMISTFSEERRYRYTTVRMGSRIVLLIKDERPGDAGALERRVGELAAGMLEGLPEARERISIGIGHRFRSLADASGSYRAACGALERAFFSGAGSVIQSVDGAGGLYKPGESLFYDIGVYCENDELLCVSEAVERTFAKFAENRGTPVSAVKSAALRICQILAQSYRKEFLENIADSSEGLQQAVMSAFSLDELAGVINRLIAKYTNAILTKDKKNGAIYGAKKYIWKHLDEDLTVKSIAGAVYLSPTYLCALFKEVAGVTVNQYVQQARMDKAKTLLLNTDLPIQEIAESVGYRNVGYFNRTFSLHAGASPALYRKTQLNA